MFAGLLATSFVARAITGGQLVVRTRSPRDFGLGKHRSIDDTPYGGGSGMVMRVDVIVPAMESLDADAPDGLRAHRVLLTPQGRVLDQAKVQELSERDAILLVCGRYEGFDERVSAHVDEEISLGDFVMTGGEVAAMAIVEACARLLPGVLGNEASTIDESHSADTGGLLEYPHYTRPVGVSRRARARHPGRRQPPGDCPLAQGAGHRAHAGAPARPLGALPRDEREERVVRRLAIALVHHPVLDGQGAIVTTAVTNLDVHDLARSARTYGCSDYFVAHPIAAQRELVTRIRDHWTDGSSGRRIPDRREALGVLRITESLEAAIEALGGRDAVEIWATAARELGPTLPFASARQRLDGEGKAVLLHLRNRMGSRAGRRGRGRRASRADPLRGRRLQSPQRPLRVRHRPRPPVRRPLSRWSRRS